MLRTVLAVVLAVALLGVSLPAADAAVREQVATRLAKHVGALADAAERLAAGNDPVAPARGGARRTTTLPVPHDRLLGPGGTAVVGACPGAADLCYRVGDGPLTAVGSTVDVRATSDALRLPAGEHRLRLRYRRTDGGPAVVVAEV